MAKKVRVAIVGCGGIANQKHMPSLAKFPERAEMVAFCDIIPERAEKAKADYGTADAKVYTDYKEMLADKSIEIDVVHVCTPNVAHCPITVAAFEAGKHVMCEKPMAHCTADAQKMIDAWKKSGKKFTIGYQNRFRDDTQTLHASCESGELGEIYMAKAHALRRRAVPTWGVFPNKSLQGGGPLIDIGTHALDITLWMMDNYEPESVSGQVFYKLGRDEHGPEGNVFGPWDPKTFEVEDSAFGLVKMKNGAVIYLEASWALNVLKSMEASTTLCGTRAGAEIHHGGSYPEDELIYNTVEHNQLMEKIISPAGKVDFFEGGAAAEAVREQDQWLDAILNDKDPLVKPEQAFVVTQILEGIYKSAESGKEVFF
ncbi:MULTISPECIES: Gfo/Idh/MocA family protein [Agathobacter]|uniref:Gfo/Idh/MocA family oxidoreductase n=1 Tax=Agathobacter ruminis TaxID=1712665 RepID=A0A2G3DZC0_9FIRM|nr:MULTISPECIES: Gfo/Idh/MocA family oxidoreductase [Agathobacter]MCR5678532.1 Gfo/Idh/MocA family oxidoreductase [Agathobacter sp.]MDC7302351.1 Gfo/Idh/MocA family oxidoreductase [Agathobacter ruminis]PHU36235.1 gfo/Idh/MocA family oxidoreductase [Agathobacter ruminis]